MTRRLLAARVVVAAGLLLACGTRAFAQETEDPAISGMSRQMRMGIRYYEKGDDLQAMDRFMDVLTNGDPSERSMANEYINLITHRMNTGEKGPAPERPGRAKLSDSRVTRLPGGDDSAAAPAPAAASAPAPRAAAPSAAVLAEPDDVPAAAPARAARVASAAPSVTDQTIGALPRAAAAAPELSAEPAAGAVARPTTERPAAPPPREEESEPAPRRAPPPDAPMTAGNRALMQREIKAKLRQSLDQGLAELRDTDGIRILMMSNGEPQAIALPSPLLFQAGIAFQKEAGKILEALTKVVFSLAGAQVVILPEGTSIGDAKVLDMRRTMGISSHLFSAGVAPPRVRVNLLNTQVDIPKPLLDFKGIVIVFVYDQPLPLVVESAIGDEAGPPISMGIFPTSIRPDKGEGSVIEFSVQDPPAGLVSWKFQLLEPSEGGPTDLAPLQEILGGNPVFHQIFWNGRRGYFGAPLAAGRYEAVLTAADSKGRQRTLHRWIQVQEAPNAFGGSAFARPAAAAPAAAAPVTPAGRAAAAPKQAVTAVTIGQPSAGAPSADLPADKPADEPLIKENPAPKKKAGRAKPSKRKPAKKKAAPAPDAADAGETAPAAAAAPAAGEAAADAGAAPAPAAEKPSKPASGSFELSFNKNTHQLTPEAEKRLAQVADTVAYYPMESLSIQGLALSSESNAASLAERRAKMVAGLLINKYQIDPKKIQVSSSVAEKGAGRVLVSFVKEQ